MKTNNYIIWEVERSRECHLQVTKWTKFQIWWNSIFYDPFSVGFGLMLAARLCSPRFNGLLTSTILWYPPSALGHEPCFVGPGVVDTLATCAIGHCLTTFYDSLGHRATCRNLCQVVVIWLFKQII